MKVTTSFAYRRYLIRIRSFYPALIGIDDEEVMRLYKKTVNDAFRLFSYQQWIRYLRKLIELYEGCRERERYLLSEEARTFVAQAVQFISTATGHNFQKICSDVSGKYGKYLDIGVEDGVEVYAGRLEEMFPNEQWELERNVGKNLPYDLKRLNEILVDNERIPAYIAEQLFDELIKEPGKMALVAIRKINRALNSKALFVNEEIWSGVCDLATSVEVHGKEWLGGNKLEDVLSKLCSRLSANYVSLKKGTDIANATNAKDAVDFMDKLTRIASLQHIPLENRCGRHLLIAHLVRNYTSHQKGLTDKILRENLGSIYGALINTLFVLYAVHKKQ